MSTKPNQKIENSIISGDAVCGDKITNFYTFNIDETLNLSLSDIVEKNISKASDSTSMAIKRFKELNPNLDLKVKQTENSVDYLIEAIGPGEVNLGIISLKNIGIEKYKKCLEEGANVELNEDEFEFDPDIKGLPIPQKDLTKTIQIINHFKQKIEPIKLIVLDNNRNIINEIFSNLHILSCGSKVMTMKISGLQLLCELHFSFNYIDLSIQSVNFNINYDTIEFEKLINTLTFFRQLKHNSDIEIILLDNNRKLFEFNASKLDMDLDEIDDEILFYNKYNNVIKHYSLNSTPAIKLSDHEYEVIQILFAYINKTAIAFINYPVVIQLNNPSDVIISKIKNPQESKNSNITQKCSITYDILGKKIEIESLKLIFTEPYISKIEGSCYYLKSNRVIFNFK